MPVPDVFVELPPADPARLAAAVHAVVTEDSDRTDLLRRGAEASMSDAPTEQAIARRFQSVLELGYLVASADGLAAAERDSLARLLESITGAAIDHDTLELHFRDLDEAVTLLGRHHRLARAAADLDDPRTWEEGIVLATAIALADGHLSAPELEALIELGRHLTVPEDRVRTLVQDVAQRVKSQLGGASQ
jgi:tellurite resistance protein